MIEKRLTRIEEVMLGGGNWATESMTLKQRAKFYRDIGMWPGLHSREATEMFMQSHIDAERARGKNDCADRKSQRAREAGLTIK